MAERVSQWFTPANNLISDWPYEGQNERGDMVGLAGQRAGTLSAHPLLMGRSQRGVGFVRPGPVFGSCSKFGLNAEFFFNAPLDYIELEDGTVLGDEIYSDPLGIG